jgi:hypothetical protein
MHARRHRRVAHEEEYNERGGGGIDIRDSGYKLPIPEILTLRSD